MTEAQLRRQIANAYRWAGEEEAGAALLNSICALIKSLGLGLYVEGDTIEHVQMLFAQGIWVDQNQFTDTLMVLLKEAGACGESASGTTPRR